MKRLNDHVVWILMILLVLVALATTCRAQAETTLLTRAFSMSETLSLNGTNLTDTFRFSPTWAPVEIKAAWVDPGSVELSYTYRSRRTFDGTGAPKIFTFRDVEFEPDSDNPLTLSGSVATHSVDARILAYLPWVAPVIRWNYTDVEMSVSGKPKAGESLSPTDHWSASSLALGACAGWRYGNIWIEGNGLIYVNRNGHQATIQALYGWRDWSIGSGYRIERNSIGPVEIRGQGPFMAVGVRF